jgi:mono/diheme cytochrome c family protein
MQVKHPRPRSGTALLGAVALAALAGCAAQPSASQGSPLLMAAPTAGETTGSDSVPGGAARMGGSTASMADQYRPRPGGTASVAAGASAWVPPAPAPAFQLSGPLPAAAPPAPPPAAVANRQRAAATPASDVARPEAAAPAAPAAAPAAPAAAAAAQTNPAVREQGLALFNNYSCSACHALADANASGSIGPSLDRNPRLTKAYSIEVITNGRGAMPAFGGQMTDEEIAVISDYIVQFARK